MGERVRFVPEQPLPPYAHVPGRTPHPVSDPAGHLAGRARAEPAAIDPDHWPASREYLWGLDLFNHGFYWEAHDGWERLCRVSGADSMVGHFLKGLVKMAAAGMKVREKSIHGVRRHAASAGEVFADVAAEAESDRYCGLEFTTLQFAADRAAQLSYRQELPAGKPTRVFPFVLRPEPLPFG